MVDGTKRLASVGLAQACPNESCGTDSFHTRFLFRDNTVTAHDGTVQSSSNLSSLGRSVGQPMYGYVMVGDNIDKNVQPAFQRLDRTTQSLHYFHSYAVLNRIDTSGSAFLHWHLSKKILPTQVDIEKLLSEFENLGARCVCVCLCVRASVSVCVCMSVCLH